MLTCRNHALAEYLVADAECAQATRVVNVCADSTTGGSAAGVLVFPPRCSIILDGESLADAKARGNCAVWDTVLRGFWTIAGGDAAQVCGHSACTETRASYQSQYTTDKNARIALFDTPHLAAPCCFVPEPRSAEAQTLDGRRAFERAAVQSLIDSGDMYAPDSCHVIFDGVPIQWIPDYDMPADAARKTSGCDSPSQRYGDVYERYDALSTDDDLAKSAQWANKLGALGLIDTGGSPMIHQDARKAARFFRASQSVRRAVESPISQRRSDSSRSSILLYELDSRSVVKTTEVSTGGPTFIKMATYLSSLLPAAYAPFPLPGSESDKASVVLVTTDLMCMVSALALFARLCLACYKLEGEVEVPRKQELAIVLSFMRTVEIWAPFGQRQQASALNESAGGGGGGPETRVAQFRFADLPLLAEDIDSPRNAGHLLLIKCLDLIGRKSAAGPCVASDSADPAPKVHLPKPFFVFYPEPCPIEHATLRPLSTTFVLRFVDLFHYEITFSQPAQPAKPEQLRAIWMLRYALNGYTATAYLPPDDVVRFNYVIAPLSILYGCFRHGWDFQPHGVVAGTVPDKGICDSDVCLDYMALKRSGSTWAYGIQEPEIDPAEINPARPGERKILKTPTAFTQINTGVWCAIVKS